MAKLVGVMWHPLTPDIKDSQIEGVRSDGADSMYLHLDNGVIIAINAGVVEGAPYLYVCRWTPGEPLEKSLQ